MHVRKTGNEHRLTANAYMVVDLPVVDPTFVWNRSCKNVDRLVLRSRML